MTKRPRIVFPDCPPYMAEHYDDALHRLLPQLEIDLAAPGPAELVRRIGACAGLVHFRTRITADIIAAVPALKVIVFFGTGVGSWVDLTAAAERGIAVRRVLGYGDRAVAEHALALMLAAARRLAVMDRDIRGGRWQCEPGRELGGSVLGIVGLGGIGRALAGMGAALGCEVVSWNRSRAPDDVPCRALPLDELLETADIVSLHLALTDETRGIIDAGRIARLKPGAILINTARGALIDEAALVARLARGDIAAGLDVFADEPLLAGHALTRLDNVVLSAHAGWMTAQASRRLWQAGLSAMAEEIGRLGAAGDEPPRRA